MPTIAVIKQANQDQIAIESPYDADYVAELKSEIETRKWAGKGTGWVIANSEADTAIEIASRHYDEVIDARNGASKAEIEDAKLEAEIEEVEANQAYILENAERIANYIAELDEVIGRYSFNSKSRIKHAYVMDRALLGHSLNNARIDVERMTELQVRGLAAAVRYLKAHTAGPKKYR